MILVECLFDCFTRILEFDFTRINVEQLWMVTTTGHNARQSNRTAGSKCNRRTYTEIVQHLNR